MHPMLDALAAHLRSDPSHTSHLVYREATGALHLPCKASDASARLEITSQHDTHHALTLHIPWSALWPCERWPQPATLHALNHCPTRIPRRLSDPRDTCAGVLHPLTFWRGPLAERLFALLHDPEQACGTLKPLTFEGSEEDFTREAWRITLRWRHTESGFFFRPDVDDYASAWLRLTTTLSGLLMDVLHADAEYGALKTCDTVLDVWRLLIRDRQEGSSVGRRAFLAREARKLVQALWVQDDEGLSAITRLELPWAVRLEILRDCTRYYLPWAGAHKEVLSQLGRALKAHDVTTSGSRDMPAPLTHPFELLVPAHRLTGPLCLVSTHLLEHDIKGSVNILRLLTWRHMSDEARSDAFALMANMRCAQTGLAPRVLHEHAPHVWLPWPKSSATEELDTITHTLISEGSWRWLSRSHLLEHGHTTPGYHALELVAIDLAWYAQRGRFALKGLNLQWLAMWWAVMVRNETRRHVSVPHLNRATHPLYLLWPYVSYLCAPLCARDHGLTRHYVRFVELVEPYAGQDNLPAHSIYHNAHWLQVRHYAPQLFEITPGEAVQDWELEMIFIMLWKWAIDGDPLDTPGIVPWVAMAMIRLPLPKLEYLEQVLARLVDADLLTHLDLIISRHPDEARRRFLEVEQRQTMKQMKSLGILEQHLRGAVEVARDVGQAGGLSLEGEGT